MTLRPEYSLGHSCYNDFLFAALGAEENGSELTVLSALTRLGVDPWQEAARLSDLPREAAAQALARTIARLPGVGWPEAELGRVARDLVATLPHGSAAPIPSTDEAPVRAIEPKRKKTKMMKSGFPVWLVWGALAIGFYFLMEQMQPSHNFETGGRPTTTQG